MRKTNIKWEWGTITHEYCDGVMTSERVNLYDKNWNLIVKRELYKADVYGHITRIDDYYVEPNKAPCLWTRSIHTSKRKGNTYYSSIYTYRYDRNNGSVIEVRYYAGLYRDNKCLASISKILVSDRRLHNA